MFFALRRVTVLGLVLGSSLALLAARAPGPPDEELETCMLALKTNLKTIGATAGDAAREDDALMALAAMQVYALKAKSLAPANLGEVPEAERGAHLRAFRTEMARLLRHLAELEIAILEGRREEAAAIVKGPLVALRDASHDKFQKADEREGR